MSPENTWCSWRQSLLSSSTELLMPQSLSITISVASLTRHLNLLLLPAPTPKAELSPLPGTSDIIIPSTQVKISEVDTTRYIHIRQGQSSTRVFRETSVWHKPCAILFSTINDLPTSSPVAAVAVPVVAADVAVSAVVVVASSSTLGVSVRTADVAVFAVDVVASSSTLCVFMRTVMLRFQK